jgi:hypothetical protein
MKGVAGSQACVIGAAKADEGQGTIDDIEGINDAVAVFSKEHAWFRDQRLETRGLRQSSLVGS